MGGGNLPRHLIATCHRHKWPYFVLAIRNHVDPKEIKTHPHLWFSMGRLRPALERLHKEGVTDVVMAGYVARSVLWTWRWDLMTLGLLLRLSFHFFQEDGLLREIVRFVESQGFRVREVGEIAEDLKMPVGALGAVKPDATLKTLITKGMTLAKEHGRRDLGQAIIITEDGAVFREGKTGTDALIRTYSSLRNPLIRGILVKACKPQQDHRVDLPTIGVDTLTRASEAGLAGVAMEAENGIILDRKSMVQHANRLGLFLYGYTKKDA